MRSAVRFTAVFLLAAPLAAQPGANSCLDPYWQTSLRCVAVNPPEPQPMPAPPATANDVKEYTRFDLESNWNLRCVDGTRPILYIDPAVGGPSDRWLFSLTGGGSCGAVDFFGGPHPGQACYNLYAGGEAGEMGTAGKPSMLSLGDEPGASQGILRTAPSANPVFAGYNRVRIQKCSYDRYDGRATHIGVTADPPGAPPPIAYDLYNHGRSIVEMALEELRGSEALGTGLTYDTWIVANGNVVQTTESLPPLERAQQVLFIGHSGGAHGLYHSIDGFADYLRSWPAFDGDVRVVLDSNFIHGPENEPRFESPGLDLFDHVWSGTSPQFGLWNAEPYYSSGSYYADLYGSYRPSPIASFDTVLDASCIAAHDEATEFQCFDRLHVLANHMTTPVLAREDFSDPNPDHTNNGNGHIVDWGPLGPYPHCAALGYSPCPPAIAVGDGSPHEARLFELGGRLLSDIRFRSELAMGDDTSGVVPTFFLWMPDCGFHSSAYDDVQFNRVALSNGASSVKMRDWLESFVAAPATGITAGRIAGFGGDVALCQGDLPFRDGFESGDTFAWTAP
jgi:hypothetical protein